MIRQWINTFSFPLVRTWQLSPPIGKKAVIPCPVCWGRLHMDQSKSGYVNGCCETGDCLVFSLPDLEQCNELAAITNATGNAGRDGRTTDAEQFPQGS